MVCVRDGETFKYYFSQSEHDYRHTKVKYITVSISDGKNQVIDLSTGKLCHSTDNGYYTIGKSHDYPIEIWCKKTIPEVIPDLVEFFESHGDIEEYEEEYEELNDEITECPVCYEPIKNYGFCITNCDHTFCMDCMVTHLQLNNSCPLCRGEVAPSLPKKAEPSESNIYELGARARAWECGYEQGVADTEVQYGGDYKNGFDEGYDSATKFAQIWREKYNALLYKYTSHTLQKTNTPSKEIRKLTRINSA